MHGPRKVLKGAEASEGSRGSSLSLHAHSGRGSDTDISTASAQHVRGFSTDDGVLNVLAEEIMIEGPVLLARRKQ